MGLNVCGMQVPSPFAAEQHQHGVARDQLQHQSLISDSLGAGPTLKATGLRIKLSGVSAARAHPPAGVAHAPAGMPPNVSAMGRPGSTSQAVLQKMSGQQPASPGGGMAMSGGTFATSLGGTKRKRMYANEEERAAHKAAKRERHAVCKRLCRFPESLG